MARRGVFVPEEVLADARLDAGEKLLLAQVLFLCRRAGVCTAGNAALAGTLGVSEREVRRSLARLVGLGLLTRELRREPAVVGGRVRCLRPARSGASGPVGPDGADLPGAAKRSTAY